MSRGAYENTRQLTRALVATVVTNGRAGTGVPCPIATKPAEPTVHLTRLRVYASPVHTLSLDAESLSIEFLFPRIPVVVSAVI